MGEEIREIGLGMGQLLLIRASTGKIGLSGPDFLNKCAHVSLEMGRYFQRTKFYWYSIGALPPTYDVLVSDRVGRSTQKEQYAVFYKIKIS